ncbi:uncharacterized protein EV422DRAFT_565397 [Fimicolochytrium jonesii]|uniref:uncharacterized protein n=1 Tax=Fimicolochytrium jonesii TaxID=1396493 RepID=UPI0022FE2BDC|nr:uncharacterized protein EV422DRAFT_565397 [Fimicolochytrium jonesii]KAI8823453.1 hypothetical protein EV422DRAFT_565397 [Fimicolochytrium jonesii]
MDVAGNISSQVLPDVASNTTTSVLLAANETAPMTWPARLLAAAGSLIPWPFKYLRPSSFSFTATVTLNYWTLLIFAVLLGLIGYLILRYRVLTIYSRLPAVETNTNKAGSVPFDLHPDTAFHDDPAGGNYPDELMGAFLSSIKIFGYLERAVFHELARHLRTRKLKAGEILFRHDDDVRDFFVVVDGAIQVFVKGADTKDDELTHQDPEDDEDFESVGRDWSGHHLLNVVKAGGTVSSLFNILSVFTDKVDSPAERSSTRQSHPTNLKDQINPSSQDVFPGLRSNESPKMRGASASPHLQANLSPLQRAQGSLRESPGLKAFKLDSTHVPDDGFSLNRPEEAQHYFDPHAARDAADGKRGNTNLPQIVTTECRTPRHLQANIAARAARDTTLAVIPAHAFQHLTEKFPKAAAHMVQVILTRFQRVTFMTLYRYLGLSKELLKIEKRVNEIAGSGLPESLFSLADFQRLRERADAIRRTSEPSYSDAGTRPNVAQRRGSRKTPERVKIPSRLRRSSNPKAGLTDDYEGDVEDSDRERKPYTASPTSPIPNSPNKEEKSFGHLLTHEGEDADMKEAIFACIAEIIGMLPYESSPSNASATASPMAAGYRSSSSTLGGYLSRNRHFTDQQRPSPGSSTNDFDDTASTSSRMSVASNASDPGSSDVHILFYERGTTLIKEGERNAGLYFVIDGTLEASVMSSIDPARNAGQSERFPGDESVGADHRSHPRSLFLIKPGGLAGYLAAVTGYISFVSIRAKTDVYVGFLPKPVLERYIDRHPNVLLSLAKRLISQLSPLVFHIDAALGWDQVNAGHILCREGEPADSIYIVLNGRLRSIVERTKEGKGEQASFEILAEYGQGESVGEMEVLTDGRRPATVHAIRDTEIAVMPNTFFNALALRHPEITIAISRLIASRSRSSLIHDRSYRGSDGISRPISKKNPVNVNMRTVAILPVNGLVPITDFARELQTAMDHVGATVTVLNTGSVMTALGKHAFTRIGRLKLTSWLADQEESHRMVIYVADGAANSPWTQRCVRQADCVLLVGIGDDDPEIGDHERVLIGMKTTARKELVLVHSARFCRTGSTAQWLKSRSWVHAHHHVQMQLNAPRLLAESARTNTVSNIRGHFQSINQLNVPHLDTQSSTLHLHTGIRSDFARLARRLLSKSVGLVLGGGGARGISHIGVIRALEEAGIPVDMVGGTSIGSFVGGLYARENDHVSVYGRAKMFAGRMVSKWRQVLDLTYPVTAMFTGHEFNRAVWKCFANTQIEDCWLPYFAVTTNITWSRMEIHQTGYMWRYVRASMSLSGYFPPLCDNGNMLLDGGYINNLPADIMRNHGAETIIAVDVGSVDDTSPVMYGDSLSGWWALAQRYVPVFGGYVTRKYGNIPLMADIQSRLTYVSSVKQLEDAKQLEGCYYLNPPVQKYGTLQFGSFTEIFQVGYKYGKEQVAKWQMDGTLRKRFGVPEEETAAWGRHGRRASI